MPTPQETERQTFYEMLENIRTLDDWRLQEVYFTAVAELDERNLSTELEK